jgi:23S rRNA pseudouridine1911/1915/1917 synthase
VHFADRIIGQRVVVRSVVVTMREGTTFAAGVRDAGRRLDVVLAERQAPELSRSRAARMIRAGLVRLNGKPARASTVLHAGDRIEVAAPPPPPPIAPSSPAAPEIEVLYSDDEIIVVNKPAGMTVHPAPGHRDATLVDALLSRFPDLAAMVEPDGVQRPGIVHRLDKDTSGVMVVARTPFARTALSRQFKDRTVAKTYLALVKGHIGRTRLTISRPVGRHPTQRKRMSVSSRAGREAVTRLGVLARIGAVEDFAATLVCLKPETGRTHQLRVHLASIGHPCLGDPVYGGRAARTGVGAAFNRQALHAFALELAHPRSGERMRFVAPLPHDLADFLAAHRLAADADAAGRSVAAGRNDVDSGSALGYVLPVRASAQGSRGRESRARSKVPCNS